MRAYLINLDSRPDRLKSSVAQFEQLQIEFERVPAVTTGEVVFTENPYVTSSVAAIWLSHLKALRNFLESENEFALILEDDFVFKLTNKRLLKAFEMAKNFDLIQIGFLKINIFEWASILKSNFADLFFKCLKLYSNYAFPFSSLLRSKFLVYSQKDISFKIVINEFRPGAHAYIVNRHFAEQILKFNNPILFSTDQFFISLAQMRSFRIARLRKSLVSQSKSSSSVSERFVLQTD